MKYISNVPNTKTSRLLFSEHMIPKRIRYKFQTGVSPKSEFAMIIIVYGFLW